MDKLAAAYKQVKVGDPFEKGVLCGPLHNQSAAKKYKEAIELIKSHNGKIVIGGNTIKPPQGLEGGFYVEPTIACVDKNFPGLKQEVFVPILNVVKFTVNSMH